jgi:hypothetical protein
MDVIFLPIILEINYNPRFLSPDLRYLGAKVVSPESVFTPKGEGAMLVC